MQLILEYNLYLEKRPGQTESQVCMSKRKYGPVVILVRAKQHSNKSLELSTPELDQFSLLNRYFLLEDISLFLLPFFSVWSTDGVQELKPNSSSTQTVCQTDHFTSFAILMQHRKIPVCYSTHFIVIFGIVQIVA